MSSRSRARASGATAGQGQDPRDIIGSRSSWGASYPRTMPEIRWLTPIYHPNISEIGMVCLGGYGTHWVPSVQLDELCVMLWDMARYHNYDIRSPYNRDPRSGSPIRPRFAFRSIARPLRDLRAVLGRGDSQSEQGETARPESDPVGIALGVARRTPKARRRFPAFSSSSSGTGGVQAMVLERRGTTKLRGGAGTNLCRNRRSDPRRSRPSAADPNSAPARRRSRGSGSSPADDDDADRTSSVRVRSNRLRSRRAAAQRPSASPAGDERSCSSSELEAGSTRRVPATMDDSTTEDRDRPVCRSAQVRVSDDRKCETRSTANRPCRRDEESRGRDAGHRRPGPLQPAATDLVVAAGAAARGPGAGRRRRGAGQRGRSRTWHFLGLGTTYLIDLDVVEPSNLSRSVLFREQDGGHPKAVVAARRAPASSTPRSRSSRLHGDVITDLGPRPFRRRRPGHRLPR